MGALAEWRRAVSGARGTTLTYAARGWPVFPCRATNKIPLIKRWGEIASRNPAQIEAWWRKSPDALIGVPTGKRTGVIVLDIDTKDPRAYGFDTLADLGLAILPDTPMAHTRSGGLHLYFACIAQEIRNSAGKSGLGPGLDVRGEGGFVIVPSPGSGYWWDPVCNFDTISPAPAPAWLRHRSKPRRTITARSHSRFDPQTVLADCCDHIRNADEGDKHHTIRREAFIAATLVRDRFITDRHARHELEAALLALQSRCKDFDHAIKAYEGAYAEGLAAPSARRARR
jgi:hypothetical protein